MDILTNRAVGTYHRFESGRISPRDDYLRDVGRILRMTEDEFTQVYLLALGQCPPRSLSPDDGIAAASVVAWQRAVAGQREMAYVLNSQWDLVAYNERFAELFADGAVPANAMRWIALAPEARESVLMEWGTRWAPSVLNQLRLARIQHPGNPALTQLHHDVLGDGAAGPIYRRSTELSVRSRDEVLPLRHPRRGPGTVTVLMSEPACARGARHVVLLFDPERPGTPLIDPDRP
ncbi:XRE family transcriptional regulator [Streptomyces sp. PmtG]